MSHKNPYRINDPNDIFEMTENSSHPELADAKRIWRFGAYTFHSATELQKFFSDEGLSPQGYVAEPYFEKNTIAGKNRIIINIVEKWKSRNQQALKGMRIDGTP